MLQFVPIPSNNDSFDLFFSILSTSEKKCINNISVTLQKYTDFLCPIKKYAINFLAFVFKNQSSEHLGSAMICPFDLMKLIDTGNGIIHVVSYHNIIPSVNRHRWDSTYDIITFA